MRTGALLPVWALTSPGAVATHTKTPPARSPCRHLRDRWRTAEVAAAMAGEENAAKEIMGCASKRSPRGGGVRRSCSIKVRQLPSPRGFPAATWQREWFGAALALSCQGNVRRRLAAQTAPVSLRASEAGSSPPPAPPPPFARSPPSASHVRRSQPRPASGCPLHRRCLPGAGGCRFGQDAGDHAEDCAHDRERDGPQTHCGHHLHEQGGV
ncbi:hypothetical protein D3C71_1569110 [compost metagenome]